VAHDVKGDVLLARERESLRELRTAQAGETKALREVQTIPMEGVEGRIDHMAVSPDGRQLFVAALGNDMVERIDTEGGTVVGREATHEASQRGVLHSFDFNNKQEYSPSTLKGALDLLLESPRARLTILRGWVFTFVCFAD